MKIKNYNSEILRQLCQNYPDFLEEARNEFPKLDLWIKKEVYPTYNQLVKLAKIFHIPFGYLFLRHLPIREYPIPHYRTFQSNTEFSPSINLLDTVYFAKKIQEWAKDILLQWGSVPLNYAGKYNTNTRFDDIITEIRNGLEISEDWAQSFKNWSDAFKFLIEKTENWGIFVLLNGIVGNNTHRKLDVDEVRGFALYDEIAPVVFINNNDSISAKIFTLIHEIVHILVGQSASFDLRELQSPEIELERFCNKCTAEFLVPHKSLIDVFNNYPNDYSSIARYFKVSEIVILRRLREFDIISKSEFNNYYNKYLDRFEKSSHKGGGDFYYAAPYRLSKKFLNILYIASKGNEILYRDTYDVTGLKWSTFDKIIQKTINI